MEVAVLKPPHHNKKLGYSIMIYCACYGSSTRAEQRFGPFCASFTSGHVKSHQKTHYSSLRIGTALNPFIPAFLQLRHTWKSTHRLYYTTALRGNTSSRIFQSVCLTQEKSTASSHQKKNVQASHDDKVADLGAEGTELCRG